MINIEEIINDPDFAQEFTVYRKSGEWIAGRFEQTETTIAMYGVITACNVKDLDQLPEGDRVKGIMCFYSTEPIYITQNEENIKRTSDEITWRDDRYKIIQILPEQDWGYYKGFGYRIAGD